MDPNIKLSDKQLDIIWYAARQLPPRRVPDFVKHIEDMLRPKRQIVDTDVTYSCAAALHKISAA